MAEMIEKAKEQAQGNRLVQLTSILVATDFSLASDRALDYALSLARRYESRIILAHIVASGPDYFYAPATPGVRYESALSVAEDEMGQILISGRLRDVRHETLVEQGPFWPILEELIERYHIDLVVVGTHNAHGLEKLFLGSMAEQVFRRMKCPVLTVGPAAGGTPKEAQFKNILFATDFGLGVEREAAFAFSLAQEHEANLTLLHVVPHAEDYTGEGLSLKREAIFQELAELVPPGSELWCKPEFRMRLGDPAREILEVARDTNADLIVMGAKRQRGLTAGHALHTVAYSTAAAAPCPVLTVRS